MAFITSLPAVATDIVLPALGYMSSEYKGANKDSIALVVSIFFAGLGIGQLVFGPICDAFGRRHSAFLGLALFILGSLICIFASSMNTLLLGRFIQALGASGPRIATMAIVRDRYEGNDMARVMSFIIMIFITVPLIAPTLGQVIIQVWNWHLIFAYLLLQAIVTACWIFFRQEETLTPENTNSINLKQLGRDFVSIMKIRSVIGYTLASAATFGLMVTYVSSAQHLFQNIYTTGARFPLYFAVIALTIGIASFVNGKLVNRLGMFKLVLFAMWLNLLSGAILVVACVAFNGVPSLTMFTIIMMVGFFGNGILMGNLTSLAMQPLGDKAGFGAAIVSSLSTLIAVPIAIVVGAFLRETITPFAIGFLLTACCSIVLANWANAHPADN